MNRTVQISAWGLAGILLTGALTGAAVAVAGNGIATPVRPFSLTSNRVEQPVREASEPHEGLSHDQGKGSSSEGAEPGGGSNGGDSTSGSNSGPGSESSGPGSGDSGGSDEGSGDSGGDHDGDDGDDDD